MWPDGHHSEGMDISWLVMNRDGLTLQGTVLLGVYMTRPMTSVITPSSLSRVLEQQNLPHLILFRKGIPALTCSVYSWHLWGFVATSSCVSMMTWRDCVHILIFSSTEVAPWIVFTSRSSHVPR
jgi:hypothetical protein